LTQRNHSISADQHTQIRFAAVSLWSALLLFQLTFPAVASAQDETDAFRPADLREHIIALSHPSYRARELARWRLEQQPLQSIVEIQKNIQSVDHNAAAQLIDLLSSMAMSSDVAVSVEARSALGDLANNTTSVGKLAGNTLNAIADLQEEKAMQILAFHGAQFRHGLFTINGHSRADPSLLGMKIDETFDGDAETIKWIRFLKSIDAIYFIGPQIDTRYFEAVSGLTRLKVIKLKRVSLIDSDLKLFRNLLALEHLGINYTPIDDSSIPSILELPVSQSLRLYGTRITEKGEAQLNNQLDGIQIYRGNGGFLGISMLAKNEVDSVVLQSAAQRAGIRVGDKIMTVDGVAIGNFEELRSELGKHVVGDAVSFDIIRQGIPVTIVAVLGEDQN
jgi:hypothetical protein